MDDEDKQKALIMDFSDSGENRIGLTQLEIHHPPNLPL